MDLTALKKKLDTVDTFAKLNGISIDSIEDGLSCVILNLSEESLDDGYVSNALIAAASEKAAFCAARSSCENCYCASSNFNVLSRAKDTALLKATAKKLHHGKRTSVYETVVADNNDNLIAKGSYTIVITE